MSVKNETNPTDAEAVKAKIENGDVKVKGQKRQRKPKTTDATAQQPTTEQPTTAQPTTEKPKPKSKRLNGELAQKMLDVLATLKANGINETTSPILRDKLELDKETGRDTVRCVMRKLADQGKVVMGEKVNGKKKLYTFSLAEQQTQTEQPQQAQ